MPRGKVSRGEPRKGDPNAGRRYYAEPDAPWGGFVDLVLEESERSDFDAWSESDAPAVWSGLAEGLVDGLNLSVKYDLQNACFAASLLGRGFGASPDRHCLLARASTPGEAIALVIYKHVILSGGDWSRWIASSGNRRQFG